MKEGPIPLTARNEAIIQRIKAFIFSLPPSIELPRNVFATVAGLDSIISALQTPISTIAQGKSKPLRSKARRARAKTITLGNGDDWNGYGDEPQDTAVYAASAVTVQEVSSTLKVELLASLQVSVSSHYTPFRPNRLSLALARHDEER